MIPLDQVRRPWDGVGTEVLLSSLLPLFGRTPTLFSAFQNPGKIIRSGLLAFRDSRMGRLL